MNKSTLKDPQISVVMSIYNEPEEWLRESISSILNQTYSDFEFIIINDNPERRLNDIILNEYQLIDDRIVIIKNEFNCGLTKSLNKGLRQAKGKYIARMDADDIATENRLKLQFEFLEKNPDYVLVGSWRWNIDEYGKKINLIKLPIDNDVIKWEMLLANRISHPTAFFKSELIKNKHEFYNDNFKRSQDYDLWCRLIQYGKVTNLPKPLLLYRISKRQITKKFQKEQFYYSSQIRRNYINNFDFSKPMTEIYCSNESEGFKIHIGKVAHFFSRNQNSFFSFIQLLLTSNFIRFWRVYKYLVDYYFKTLKYAKK